MDTLWKQQSAGQSQGRYSGWTSAEADVGELSVELAWDDEHRALIQDRAAPVGASVAAVVSLPSL